MTSALSHLTDRSTQIGSISVRQQAKSQIDDLGASHYHPAMINASVVRRCAVRGLIAGSLFLITTTMPAAAAEPVRGPTSAVTPFFVKSAATLAELEKTLEGKGAHGAALLNPGASPLEIVWRHEEDYEQSDLELHDRKEHVFFVTDGQATLTLGGQLVAPHEVSPGEWKGQSSRNSQTVEVHKGDLVFIPSGTAHSRSARGRRFTMLQLSFWPRGLYVPKPPAPPTTLHPPQVAPAKPATPPTAHGPQLAPPKPGSPPAARPLQPGPPRPARP
jgi:mannose-6-phosphate isomerase-like protein (cupin superfamily)